MLRELVNRSRRKWVVGGALSFGSVALLSTGFATWVIGASSTYQDGQLSVAVDTARNDTFLVSATLTDNTLFIAESATSGNKYFNVANNGSEEIHPDFEISVNVKVTVGQKAYNEKITKDTDVRANAVAGDFKVYLALPSIHTGSQAHNLNAANLVSTSQIDAVRNSINTAESSLAASLIAEEPTASLTPDYTVTGAFRSHTDNTNEWAYVRLVQGQVDGTETIYNSGVEGSVRDVVAIPFNLANDSWVHGSGSSIYSLEKTIKLTLGWGDFFNNGGGQNLSPTAFYTAKLEGKLDTFVHDGYARGFDYYGQYTDAVYHELDAMFTALSGNDKLTLRVTTQTSDFAI